MKKQLILGILISAVCLYFAFRGISFRAMFASLRAAELRWIFIALAVYGTGYLFRALRWQVLMEPVKPLKAQVLFPVLIIGFFANNILPFRMGEFVRAYLTGRKFKISGTASLGTIVIERIADTLSFLSTFLAVAIFFPFPTNIKRAALAMAAMCILLILVLIGAVVFQSHVQDLLALTPIPNLWRQRLQKVIYNFTHGVSGMRNLSYIVATMALSLIVWTIEGLTLYLMARAFPTPITLPQSYFLLFFLGLSVTLPQAPGFVGTVEFFGVTALQLLNIPKESGLPMILTIHGSQFLFIMLIGSWALWKEGLSLGSIMHARQED